jgi:methionine sulfoxide reductase catalytic subunit
MVKIHWSEITPEHIYLNRRKFMVGGALAAGALALTACGSSRQPEAALTDAAANQDQVAAVYGAGVLPAALAHAEPFASTDKDELGAALNKFEDITNYNNYYEFSMDKEGVAGEAQDFKAYPWQIEVGGLVDNPKTFDIDEVYKKFAQEERIYRLRCVEAWSMVIPWVGFPISALLKEVGPKNEAKFVRFETVMRPEEMPGQRMASLSWPYQEGLRMDEAMHPLAIFATGMYGKALTNQQGAPFRLVVPWKYGFKSIKSIVKIELVDAMPSTAWNTAASNEYGFYANVNPNVNHPRWSQQTERRIGQIGRAPTLMFNGYEDEVASLYTGMDLARSY